ncbi:methyltransferase domain-containing protein [Methylomarinum sp. Ch1-1]|uniref:Methyltransferase domain-containing protein n=1 Tax=Methylomarinum roseum TaxID=3067653 RepID=A0AAU7NU15_9GAMM|nr:methyltransferase domain-containing protein [Methylomarinum sp. Ch1-1]MDP4519855.1 methyltransferase domain-containing protein [Methylomarinum sp. Ch1-1]
MTGYHNTRLAYDDRRELLWKTLCESYFQNLVSEDASVLELGAGYGHFINNIQCKRRIAIDKWKDFPNFVKPEIEYHIGNAANLDFIEDQSIDFVFASNLFEHLTQDEFSLVLENLHNKLSKHGTLNILQPNFRFAYREYFDDYTHISIYSDRSLVDFLESNGFKVIYCKPRFLPLTIKSKIPVIPFLIKLYLKLPIKPMGKQMFVRAKKL